MSESSHNHVAILGEVLFDLFPGNKRILGGAPFNVAWNLHGLGTSSLFLSSIGNDSDGNEILDRMDHWGISKKGIGVHENFPTGSVTVSIGDNGEPNYQINLGVAYDEFSANLCDHSLRSYQPHILYHGSLSFRTKKNREFLASLQSNYQLPRFVDLNLREPWVNRDWMGLIIGDCRWLKLNANELAWLSESEIDPTSKASIQAAIDSVAANPSYAGARTYLITCGESGAWWIDNEVCIHKPAAKISNLVDSVGAGDAFAAATIHGIVNDRSPRIILEDAISFAAKACSLQGATTGDRSHYKL